MIHNEVSHKSGHSPNVQCVAKNTYVYESLIKSYYLLPLFILPKMVVTSGVSDQVLDGLYVVDGSILPVAVGVNPTLTISCLAERCMRLLAKREGWEIDYDSFKPLGKPTKTFCNLM